MSWLATGLSSWWLVLVLLTVGFDARAATKTIELTIAPDTAETRPLERAVRELLTAQRVEVRTAFAVGVDPRSIVRDLAPSSDPQLLARAWVDLDDLDHCILYLAESNGERLLVRRLPPAESWELARESAARVLSTSLEALLSGARIGLTREHWENELGIEAKPPRAAPTSPKAAPAPTSRRPAESRSDAPGLRPEAGLGYEAAAYATPFELAHGPLVEFGVTRQLGRNQAVTLLAAGQYRLPISVETAGLDVRLGSESVRVMGRFEQRLVPKLAAFAGLGAAIDFVHFSAQAAEGAGVQAAPDKSFSLPLIRTALGAELLLLADIGVWSEISLDWDSSRTRFLVQTGSGSREVLSLWRYRPAFCAGVWIPL